MTMLLAILSSNRASELTNLDIRYVVFKENSVIFQFSKLTKTWKKGIGPPSIECKGFEKAGLSVIRCLKQYLLITTEPLISYIRPHNPVSLDTVSCRVKQFLRLSGIDTSIFTGHSTRTASASKAKRAGKSLPEILKRGQWANKTTFETFYDKPIVDNWLEILQGK